MLSKDEIQEILFGDVLVECRVTLHSPIQEKILRVTDLLNVTYYDTFQDFIQTEREADDTIPTSLWGGWTLPIDDADNHLHAFYDWVGIARTDRLTDIHEWCHPVVLVEDFHNNGEKTRHVIAIDESFDHGKWIQLLNNALHLQEGRYHVAQCITYV